MEISEQVYNLINILFQVTLWSLIISTPFIILTLEMYAYDRYKKWKNTEEKEFEQIIVGKTYEKENIENTLQELEEKEKRMSLEVELLEVKLKAYKLIELPEVITLEETSAISESTVEITEDLTINELKTIAKKKGLSGYSKLSKEELLKLLKD